MEPIPQGTRMFFDIWLEECLYFRRLQRSAHPHWLDRPISDVLRIVTGCLKPTEYLPVLSRIPRAEFRRRTATLSLARQSLNPSLWL